MKKLIKHLFTTLILTVILTACKETTPAGFWMNFHKDLIISENSDQGPWGGTRKISWKSTEKNTFNNKLIEYAEKNGWKIVDSLSLLPDSLTENSFSKLKINDYSLDILKRRILPNLNPKDHKIYIFKTTWLAVEPGNERESFENGFAVLNKDRTELNIYHFWGE